MSDRNARVEAGIEYLVNVGNFENVKVIAHVSANVPEGADIQEYFNRVYKVAEDSIEARVEETIERYKPFRDK